jgi:hypothetical protein
MKAASAQLSDGLDANACMKDLVKKGSGGRKASRQLKHKRKQPGHYVTDISGSMHQPAQHFSRRASFQRKDMC